MSAWAEFLVGVALLLVGALAVRTAFGLKLHSHEHHHNDASIHRHLHLHVRGQSNHRRHAHAASGLGLLHGLAGASHLLAVIPALALPPLGARRIDCGDGCCCEHPVVSHSAEWCTCVAVVGGMHGGPIDCNRCFLVAENICCCVLNRLDLAHSFTMLLSDRSISIKREVGRFSVLF